MGTATTGKKSVACSSTDFPSTSRINSKRRLASSICRRTLSSRLLKKHSRWPSRSQITRCTTWSPMSSSPAVPASVYSPMEENYSQPTWATQEPLRSALIQKTPRCAPARRWVEITSRTTPKSQSVSWRTTVESIHIVTSWATRLDPWESGSKMKIFPGLPWRDHLVTLWPAELASTRSLKCWSSH